MVKDNKPVFKAIHRYARISPRKARLVADLVRGKGVNEAILILKYNVKRGSSFVSQVIESALANAENQQASIEDLRISTITVDGGPIIKRWSPRAMGRATPINKRTSHISVELS